MAYKKWRTWINLSKNVTFSKSVEPLEKSRPERDPKWTRLCDLLPAESDWWRHFQLKHKDYRVLLGAKFLSC